MQIHKLSMLRMLNFSPMKIKIIVRIYVAHLSEFCPNISPTYPMLSYMGGFC